MSQKHRRVSHEASILEPMLFSFDAGYDYSIALHTCHLLLRWNYVHAALPLKALFRLSGLSYGAGSLSIGPFSCFH